MNVTQICVGRFHHFHLARQLEKAGMLDAIYTGYPAFKLQDEQGIPAEKVKTFPYVQGLRMMLVTKFKLDRWPWGDEELAWLASDTLDTHVARKITKPTIVVELSGAGLRSGLKAKQLGGRFVCDRGSSHIRFQDQILREEFEKWKVPFRPIDKRMIEKEENEYRQADRITVPSEFVRKSFIEMGVDPGKISKVMYGARLERFSKQGEPDKNKFIVLWVGGVSLRKGFLYLLDAFKKFRHPNKELQVVGGVSSEMDPLIKSKLENVRFLGLVPNDQLPKIYSSANVFVLPSLEEGLAMVQGEALACGCPIISSTNSGAEDLITNGKEGIIVPIRSVEAISDALQRFADEPGLREQMSEAAIKRVQSLGGWDSYGSNYSQLLREL